MTPRRAKYLRNRTRSQVCWDRWAFRRSLTRKEAGLVYVIVKAAFRNEGVFLP